MWVWNLWEGSLRALDTKVVLILRLYSNPLQSVRGRGCEAEQQQPGDPVRGLPQPRQLPLLGLQAHLSQSSARWDSLMSTTTLLYTDSGCSMTTTEGRKPTQFETISVSFLFNESIRNILKYFYFWRDWTSQWTWKMIIHTKYLAHWSV